MLPAGSRLTRAEEFSWVIRGGRRGGRPRLVVHVRTMDDEERRAGFVVSRAVGGSVQRHRVARRLRHLVADRLPGLPPGTRLVVRALPPAAGASSVDLGADLDAGLRAAGRRRGGER